MSTCLWQQILALDARYNAYRSSNNPTFRALYIRRRSQLLREYSGKKWNDSSFQKDYLAKRSELLAEKYGRVVSDGIKSRSLSVRSGSQVTLEGENDTSSRKIPTFPVDNDILERKGYEFEGIHCQVQQHEDSVTRVRFAHDEQMRVALASMDGTITILKISGASGDAENVLRLKGHKKGVIDIVWSISNDFLLSCSMDSTLRLWDPDNGQCKRIIDDNAPVLCCLFQPINNNLVVTGNLKGLVQVLNISTGKYVKTGTCKMSGAAVCMCCDNSGRYLWVGDDKGTILSFLMDATLGKLVKGRRIFVMNNCPVTSISCRPWGSSSNDRHVLLLVNSASNAVYIYSVVGSNGNLKLVQKIPIQHRRLTIHSAFCPLVSFRQGAFAISGGEDGFVHLLDLSKSDRSNDKKLKGHTCPVIDVCFNHDESFLVSGDSKGIAIVWRRKVMKDID